MDYSCSGGRRPYDSCHFVKKYGHRDNVVFWGKERSIKMSSVAAEKEKIRKTMLKRRDMISSTEVSEKSRLIQLNVMNSRHFLISETLGVYLPIGSEVRTEEIIRRALQSAKKVALPRIESDKMTFIHLNDRLLRENNLVVGKFGIKEPGKQGT